MKYPQLVSTRAVNAISDWLVSRLEQLGVEAPLIYSRLLLSLLHSSVQINDPIEFNNLETYLANRKGQKRHHNHHYTPTDANTLKKLTAIQCLAEAVPSDQEISNIETLVDELCDKLNDIEKQLDSDDKEYQTIGQIINFITVVGSTTETSDITTEAGGSTTVSSSSKATSRANNFFAISSFEENSKNLNISNRNSINLNIFTRQRNNKSNKARVVIDLNDIEDPRKRYYNAFPALTKEMEDSFRNSNRYTKALTWPNDKTTSFIQQHIKNNNNNNYIDSKNNNNIANNNLASSNINNQNEVYIRSNSNNLNNINTAGVKRKPKRRRNQAMSKGRTSNNHQRKISYSGNCSPTWDTDFEGSWEMGRDLIKEFIIKENNRNRSTSESAAHIGDNNNNNNSNNNRNNNNNYNNNNNDNNNNNNDNNYNCNDNNVCNKNIEQIKREKYPCSIDNNNDENVLNRYTSQNYQKKNLFVSDSIQNSESDATNLGNLIFQCSVSSDIMQNEISSTTISNSNNLQINNIDPNNLLSDEGYSTHENLTSLSELDNSVIEVTDQNKNDKTNRNYYLNSAQRRLYEREYLFTINNNDDSSMSLCSNIEQQQYDFAQFKAKFNSSVEALWKSNVGDQNENSNFSNNSDELRSLPVVQQHEGLSNFWMNYYNHRYENFQDPDEEQQRENLEQRNFLSMPSQIKTNSDLNQKPLVFLQDSIWSDSAKNYDDDESFYANVKKCLQQKKLKEIDGNDQYENYPHNVTKFQEDINEILIENQSLNSAQQSNSYTHLNYEMRDIMLNNPSLYNYLQQNLQPNDILNLLPSSNSEYNEEITNLSKEAKHEFQQVIFHESDTHSHNAYEKNQIQSKELSPTITLSNHSSKSSAFVEYSNVKKQAFDNCPQSGLGKIYFDNNNLSSSHIPTYDEEENLLTSDRTHFRPIKQTYVDGYVFDICNFLDEIEYERSQSGFLCYDGGKYLEFVKLDGGANFYEDDRNSLNEKQLNNHGKSISKKRKREELVLKFRVSNKNEKFCQTDPPSRNSKEKYFGNYINLQKMNDGRLSQNINDQNFHNQFISESESDNASNYYYFEEENRSSTSTDDYEKFDGSFIYNSSSNKNCSNIESAKAAAAVIMAAVANNNNQLEINKKLENWSMFDISKKCSATTSVNNYNLIGNNNDNHTLWGTCPACDSNQELKSIPANRLLKDELKLEGDEIMSDLKNMQDLYIGSDWEEGTCSSTGGDSDNLASDIIETDYEIDRDLENNFKLDTKIKSKKLSLLQPENFCCENLNKSNNSEECVSKDESQQAEIYYNVTKLIADLLKPGNGLLQKSLANALGEAAIQAANVHAQINNNNLEIIDSSKELGQQDSQSKNFCSSIWTDNEHVIWKQNELKPFNNYLSKFNSSNNNNLLDTTSSEYLNWEYSNLADIWKQESQLNSTQNFIKGNAKCNEEENVESKTLKHVKYDIKSNFKNPKTHLENEKNESSNLLDSFGIQNKEISSNICELKENLKQNITDIEETSKFDMNSNPSFGISKKNNRFDRKRRHSASQMITNNSYNNTESSRISVEKLGFTDSSVISSTNNNNEIRLEDASKFNKNISNTTINNILGKGRETRKFEISNNCRNFLNNCQNIIGGGDSTKDKKHFNFYENFIISGNKIELMTTTAKDLLIKTNLSDYVIDNNDNDSDSKVTSSTEKKTASGTSGATIIACNYWTLNTKMGMAKDVHSNDSAFWKKDNSCLDYDYDNIGGISAISSSSILKHVALVSRPLTR